MILDKSLELSLLQAVTVDAVSTNTYDLGAANRQIGTGEPIGVGLIVTTAADITTGDETYSIEIIESASADLSGAVVIARRTIPAAALTLGSTHFIGLPPGKPALRYLGINFDTSGVTPILGVSAYLMPTTAFDTNPKVAYPSGFSVA